MCREHRFIEKRLVEVFGIGRLRLRRCDGGDSRRISGSAHRRIWFTSGSFWFFLVYTPILGVTPVHGGGDPLDVLGVTPFHSGGNACFGGNPRFGGIHCGFGFAGNEANQNVRVAPTAFLPGFSLPGVRNALGLNETKIAQACKRPFHALDGAQIVLCAEIFSDCFSRRIATARLIVHAVCEIGEDCLSETSGAPMNQHEVSCAASHEELTDSYSLKKWVKFASRDPRREVYGRDMPCRHVPQLYPKGNRLSGYFRGAYLCQSFLTAQFFHSPLYGIRAFFCHSVFAL